MRLIDADSLGDVCTRLNEDGWRITRGEFKLIDRVLLEFPNAERKGEWIPCSEISKMDEVINCEVLCCSKYGDELIGWLGYNDGMECWVCESDGCVMYDVVAFMAKPDPYREGKE